MPKSLKIARIGTECVACGCCVQACPRDAVRIVYGITARITPELCVGCGRCAKTCPADVIDIVERGAAL